MNITREELEAVQSELAECLIGGKVQEARQPSDTALWLAIRLPGASEGLWYETAPRRARAHLSPTRPATRTPVPGFLARVRKELVGMRVTGVEMPWLDRVLVTRLASPDGVRQLIFEASGHHANLFLADAQGVLLATLQPSRSHQRTLLPGQPYTPPPDPPGETAPAPAPRIPAGASPSAALAAHFAAAERETAEADLRRRVAGALQRAQKRVQRTRRKVEADLARAHAHQEDKRLGELLKIHLHRVRRGMERISVPDVFDLTSPPVEIPLRPELSPQENLEALFARYKKGARAVARIAQRQTQIATQEDRLRALTERLARCRDAREVAALAREAAADVPALRTLEQGPKRRQPPPQHVPWREFLAGTGRTILVGRGGKDNHALTFQKASPHDVWLHARGFAGSHVIIPLARNQEPDAETLLDAGHLAIHYSKAPDEGFCEVMWTRRKHVRAIRKGAPGQVTVHADSNLEFDFSPARLDSLLARRPQA